MLLKLLAVCVSTIAFTQAAGTPEVMSKCVIEAFLKVHNEARANVSLPPLEWSNKLSDYASDWSGRCESKHSRGNYGENIFYSAPENKNVPVAEQAVRAWVSEIEYVDDEWKCFTRSEENCGHYSQVVWRDTQRVGCGLTHCANLPNVVVCSYDPPGNYVGRKPY